MKDTGRRIVEFLRTRGAPASSIMLAERFLRAGVASEDLATRLLRPLMEDAGAVYEQGAGWSPAPPEARAAGGTENAMVAAVIDRSGRAWLACPEGEPPATLASADVVMMLPSRDADRLRAWAIRSGRGSPRSVVSLRRVVGAAAGRMPRRAGLADFCAALGVRWLDSEEPAGAARAMAACIREAALVGAESPEVPPAEPELPIGITRDMLRALPGTPGVYRFFDPAGALLYVGKAANLKRRVSSYFSAAAAKRPRRFYARIHRLEYDAKGTELEALLEEARLIARRSPAGNVQVQVRERTRGYDRARVVVLLLPEAGGRILALAVREDRCLGRVSLGPRGGGMAAVSALIRRAIRGGGRAAKAAAPLDRDSEILRSWMARHGESVSRLDLDGFRSAAAAVSALRRAARELRSPEASGGSTRYR